MTTALVETHTAVVLAVGDRVFKAKKSVRFPLVDLSSVEYRSGRYDAPHKAAVYDELLRRAAIALGHGESVVLDATWLDPQARELAAAAARSTSSHLVEMRCTPPPNVARERIIARATAPAQSDVTPDMAERIASEAPSWTTAQELDTTGSSDDAVFIAAQRLA